MGCGIKRKSPGSVPGLQFYICFYYSELGKLLCHG